MFASALHGHGSRQSSPTHVTEAQKPADSASHAASVLHGSTQAVEPPLGQGGPVGTWHSRGAVQSAFEEQVPAL